VFVLFFGFKFPLKKNGQQRKILAKSFWFLPQKMTGKKKGLFFSSWGKETLSSSRPICRMVFF